MDHRATGSRAGTSSGPCWVRVGAAIVPLLAPASFTVGCDRAPGTEAAPAPSACSSPMGSTASASSSAARLEASAHSSAGVGKPARAPCGPRSDPTKLVWMGPDYELVMAQPTIDCLSEAERVAVGYVATTVGSQCRWESDPDARGEGGRMQCKLTSALGLGDQCGDRHKALMKRWLGDDLPERCWKIPITAYAQAVVDEVTIATSGTTITVAFKATGTTGPGGSAWSWSETLRFVDEGSSLDLVKHDVRGKPF